MNNVSPYYIPGVCEKSLSKKVIIKIICEEINRTDITVSTDYIRKKMIITPENISLHRRFAELKLARQIVITFFVYFLDMSITEASSYFTLNHATGIHAIKKIATFIRSDKVISSLVMNCLYRMMINKNQITTFRTWLYNYENKMILYDRNHKITTQLVETE